MALERKDITEAFVEKFYDTVIDGWYDDEPIDWEQALERAESYDHDLDFGNSMISPRDLEAPTGSQENPKRAGPLKMATLFKADGSKVTDIHPIDGKHFTLRELYALVGCQMVEHVTLADGSDMWLDEEGKIAEAGAKPFNEIATDLLWLAGGSRYDYIAGDALVTFEGETE